MQPIRATRPWRGEFSVGGGLLTDERAARRLAAILAADVVGYSRLMGRDENGTLARFKSHVTERLEPTLARHGGRLVKLTGDGALVEFVSAVGALGAAVEFQQAMAEANRDQPADAAMVFRIGVHLGDLIEDGNDVYGDAVNIAARLEAQAPPGGIVVSRTVHEAVAGRVKAAFEDLGNLELKNIERPIQAFRVAWQAADWPVSEPAPTTAPIAGPPPLPDKPSIAVLPFQNMSGDPEQEYFVDGLVEEIITGLSRSKAIFVIARNSSFTYKGRAVDVRQIGRELGVRYVLEGSVRKAGNRLRITGQLIEAENGVHLWADRFDGDLADIFDLQDMITAQVIGAIAPRVELAEIERARRKTTNLDAYDYYLRAWAAMYRFSSEGSQEALGLLEKAIALDPHFAIAYATEAVCYFIRRAFSWSTDPAHEAAEAERLARRAMELDSSDARVLTFYAQTLIYNVGRLDEAVACLDQAIRADPNYANAWMWRGNTRSYLGDAERAIEDLQQALRLSPLDSTLWIAQTGMANAHFLRGRYEEALSWVSAALRQHPHSLSALRVAIAANALAGHLDTARQLVDRYRELDPTARLAKMREWWWFRGGEDVEKYLKGFRLAGMPD
jgi:TolB-like protein/class 3 adenylate cyclase/Tfp pilus assembly protein PilF